MCQLAWHNGCSAAGRTITSGGGSAADVPPSAANGAAVEPLRAPHCSRHSAARLRAWRVAGVAFGTPEHRAERSAATCERGPIAKRASVMHSMTDEEARDPRARERAAACLSRLCRPDRVASGMEPVRGETPVPRWLDAKRDSPATQRGDATRRTGRTGRVKARAPTPTIDMLPASAPRSVATRAAYRPYDATNEQLRNRLAHNNCCRCRQARAIPAHPGRWCELQHLAALPSKKTWISNNFKTLSDRIDWDHRQ